MTATASKVASSWLARGQLAAASTGAARAGTGRPRLSRSVEPCSRRAATAFLQQRHHAVDELVEARRHEVRAEDERRRRRRSGRSRRSRRPPAPACRRTAPRSNWSITSSRRDSPFSSAIFRHFATVANRSWCTKARPWMIGGASTHPGRRRAAGRRGRTPTGRGSRPARSRISAVCGVTCWLRTSRCRLLRLGRGVAEHERGRREDLEVVGAAAVARPARALTSR